MYTSTACAAIAAIAGLVSAAPGAGAGAAPAAPGTAGKALPPQVPLGPNPADAPATLPGDDGKTCPKWDTYGIPIKTGKNQCCTGEASTPKDQVFCCYTSGKGINREQLRCSDPEFADYDKWTRNYMCNTKQWPEWACIGFHKMPQIMAKYPDRPKKEKLHQDKKRDGMSCPAWGLENIGSDQCCVSGGSQDQLNCCYTSGDPINGEQMPCTSPWFKTQEKWNHLEQCSTRQVPQTACNGVPKLREIMAKYPEIDRHGQYW